MPAPGPEIILAPPPADAIVTPQQLTEAKALVSEVLRDAGGYIPVCDTDKLMSDYYALSVVNCDTAQVNANATSTPITACPAACQMGVVHVNAACTTAFNLAYVERLAAQRGLNFTLEEFDRNGVASLCGAAIDPVELRVAYSKGEARNLIQDLQPTLANLTSCNATLLSSRVFSTSMAQCNAAASAGTAECNPLCSATINLVGIDCMDQLAAEEHNELREEDYALLFAPFEKCGVSWNVPALGPSDRIPALMPPPNSPPPPPESVAVGPAAAPPSASEKPHFAAGTVVLATVIALLVAA